MFQTPQSDVGGLQGSRISLISKSEIRYEGFLYSINPEENTVALRNVRMFGTEGRKDGPQIPPGEQLYEFIIFRGSDIKDLTVFDTAKAQESQRPPDPAVINAWQAAPSSWKQQRPPEPPQQYGRRQERQWEDNQYSGRGDDYDRQNDGYGQYRNQMRSNRPPQQRFQQRREPNARYGYGYRRSNNQHTGRNFRPMDATQNRREYQNDFDFVENNKKLDLTKVAQEINEKTAVKYDKNQGFFDELSCEALERQSGQEPRRVDRDMREQQKQLDRETFGNTVVDDRGGYGFYGFRRGPSGGGRSSYGSGRGYGGSAGYSNY